MKKYVSRAFRVFQKKHNNVPTYNNNPDKPNINVNKNEKSHNKVDRTRSSKPENPKHEQLVLLKKKKALMLYKIILDRLMSPFMELFVPITNVRNLNDYRTHEELIFSQRDVNMFDEELCIICNEVPTPFDFTKKSLEIEDCVIKSPFDVVKDRRKEKHKKSFKTKCHSQHYDISNDKIQKSSYLYNVLLKRMIDYTVESMMPNMNSGKMSKICDFRINNDPESTYPNVSIPVKVSRNVSQLQKDTENSNNINAENILQSDPSPFIMAIPLNTVLDVDIDNNLGNKPKQHSKTYNESDKHNKTHTNIKSHAKVIPPSPNILHEHNQKDSVVQKSNMINSRRSENSPKVNQANINVVDHAKPSHNKLAFQSISNQITYTQQSQNMSQRTIVIDDNKTASGELLVNKIQETMNSQHNLMQLVKENATQNKKEINSVSDETIKIKLEDGRLEYNIKPETPDLISILKTEDFVSESVVDPIKITTKNQIPNAIEKKTDNFEDVELNIDKINMEQEVITKNKLTNVVHNPIIESDNDSNNSIESKTDKVMYDNSDKIVKEIIKEENNTEINKNITMIPVITNKEIDQRLKIDDVQLLDNVSKSYIKSHLVSFKIKDEEGYLLTRELHNGQPKKGDLIDINSVIEEENKKLSSEIKKNIIESKNSALPIKSFSLSDKKALHSQKNLNLGENVKVNPSSATYSSNIGSENIQYDTVCTSNSQINPGETNFKNNNIQNMLKLSSQRHSGVNKKVEKCSSGEIIGPTSVFRGLLSNKGSADVGINPVMEYNSINNRVGSYNTQIRVSDTAFTYNIKKDSVNSTNKTNHIERKSDSKSIEFADKVINETQEKKTLHSIDTIKKGIDNKKHLINKSVSNVQSDLKLEVKTQRALSSKHKNDKETTTPTIEISSPIEKPIKQTTTEHKIAKMSALGDVSPNKTSSFKNSAVHVSSRSQSIKADKPNEKYTFSDNHLRIGVSNENIKFKNTLVMNIGNNKGNIESKKTMEKQDKSRNDVSLSTKYKSNDIFFIKKEHKVPNNEVVLKSKMNELLKKNPVTGQPLKTKLHNEYKKKDIPDNITIKRGEEMNSLDKLELDSNNSKPGIVLNNSSNEIVKNGKLKLSHKVKPKEMLKNIQSNMLNNRLEKKVILDDLKQLENIINVKSASKKKLPTNQQVLKMSKQPIKDVKVAAIETGSRLRKVAKIVPHNKIKVQKENILVEEKVPKLKVINDDKDKNTAKSISNLKSFINSKRNN